METTSVNFEKINKRKLDFFQGKMYRCKSTSDFSCIKIKGSHLRAIQRFLIPIVPNKLLIDNLIIAVSRKEGIYIVEPNPSNCVISLTPRYGQITINILIGSFNQPFMRNSGTLLSKPSLIVLTLLRYSIKGPNTSLVPV